MNIVYKKDIRGVRVEQNNLLTEIKKQKAFCSTNITE